MNEVDLFLRFGASIGIGFLIGVQREFAHRDSGHKVIAGERTFALLGLAGALAAFAAEELGTPLIIIATLAVLGAFTAISYYIDASRGHVGLTTEVAVVIAILIGVLCFWGYLLLALAIGVGTTTILSLKLETDRFVHALEREDVVAALQVAIISAIVLPILPNDILFMPPFDVLKPFNIWLMVVFISGISFVGYVAIKLIGPQKGISITGLLGGMISSTAVTLSFAQRSVREAGLCNTFGLAILIAWTMMFPRILIAVAVVYPPLLGAVWIPIVVMGLTGLIYGFIMFRVRRSDGASDVEFRNPFDLGSALKFGLAYALVLIIARTGQIYFGDLGLYASAVAAGLADVNAITLTLSELTRNGTLAHETASRGIVLAAIANTVTKGGIAMAVGSKELRRMLLPAVLLMVLAAVVTAFLI